MSPVLSPSRPALHWGEPVLQALHPLLACLEDLALEARERQRPGAVTEAPRLQREDLDRLLVEVDAACVAAIARDPGQAEALGPLLRGLPLLRDLGRHCLSLIWKGHRLEFMLPPFLVGPLEALAIESSAMALRVIEAIRRNTPALADAVVDQDDWVDGVHHQMRSRAVQVLLRDPAQALPVQSLLDLAKHWEGLADASVRLARRLPPRS